MRGASTHLYVCQGALFLLAALEGEEAHGRGAAGVVLHAEGDRATGLGAASDLFGWVGSGWVDGWMDGWMGRLKV